MELLLAQSIVLMIIVHQTWQITKVVPFVKYMKMCLEIDVVLEIAQALWLYIYTQINKLGTDENAFNVKQQVSGNNNIQIH